MSYLRNMHVIRIKRNLDANIFSEQKPAVQELDTLIHFRKYFSIHIPSNVEFCVFLTQIAMNAGLFS